MNISQTSLVNNLDALGEQNSSEFSFFTYTANQLLLLSDEEDIRAYYKEIIAYSILQSQMDLTNNLNYLFTDRLRRMLYDKPIIVSFHFGLYRLLPLSILNNGFKLCIMVSKDILKSQISYYSSVLSQNLFDNLAFIDAENSSLFFQMRKYLKKGYLLLIYADGGSGVQNISISKSHSTSVIEFQKGQLRTRTGCIDLAFILQKPICLIFSPAYTEDTNYSFDYHDLYYQDDSSVNRLCFRKKVINSLYAHLESILIKDPFAFEGWLSLHSSIIPQHTDQYLLNPKSRFRSYNNEQGQFIFDKFAYRVYMVK